MKVSQFLKENGLTHFVDGEPQGFTALPEVKGGAHRLRFFVKESEGRVSRCLFNASKRCKKLLALAEVTCRRAEELGRLPEPEELNSILELFSGERDVKKMRERLELVKRALER
ncbi:hypothetical protein [Thermovibrio ammonificans]|uniref:Uncharacterized protein n=1 Tax=Thermovibrio ammonificans (strain DSM 15698 / JCM 12110 / HB-1) TaxID=648996 RepID=E8T3E2_THEA1|nr:hypothetical protein [Thermovibrio ammonificans]ADU97274.1 hypothetical protein Theam_1311 [Thermovibrio ammonificans HB-1]